MPRPDLDGETLLSTIRRERLARWLEGRRSATRLKLLAPLATKLLTPADLAPANEDPVPPLRWLLAALVDGEKLTPRGNLNRGFVQDAARRFGWWDPAFRAVPRSEDDVYDLFQVRELAEHLKLVKASDGEIRTTKAGRALLDDPAAIVRAVVRGLLTEDGFILTVTETVLALLITEDAVPSHRMVATVSAVVAEEGWRDAATGEPADDRSISMAAHVPTNLLRALNLLSRGGDILDRSYGLTDVGRTIGIEALRQRAIGPRTSS